MQWCVFFNLFKFATYFTESSKYLYEGMLQLKENTSSDDTPHAGVVYFKFKIARNCFLSSGCDAVKYEPGEGSRFRILREICHNKTW